MARINVQNETKIQISLIILMIGQTRVRAREMGKGKRNQSFYKRFFDEQFMHSVQSSKRSNNNNQKKKFISRTCQLMR